MGSARSRLLSFAALSLRHQSTAASMVATAPPPIPDGMKIFLTRKLAAAIATPGTAPTAEVARLIDALIAAAPDEAPRASWVHAQFDMALRAVEKEPAVATALKAGEIGLLDAVDHHAAYSEAAAAMYHTINGHHRELREVAGVRDAPDDSLRTAAGEDASADDAWLRATSDGAKLRAYADAATRIGTRQWVRAGVQWMAKQAGDFFCDAHAGGGSSTVAGEPQLFRLARKEATRLSYESRGTPLEPEEEDALRTALRRERAAMAGCSSDSGDASIDWSSAWSRPVRLLDVGACGTLFEEHSHIEDTPIDLCPQEGNPRVMQCDFLTLNLGPPGSDMVVAPSDEFEGGRAERLPAGSYDAVALSLVLSYLPSPKLRGAMIRKARRMLPTPDPPIVPTSDENGDGATPRLSRGLLLIADTFSIDGRHSNRKGGYVKQWIESIESEGFVFLRHQVLARSHVLAFATAAWSDEQAEAASRREPPELRMRREERG